ncbi:MAG: UDP-N-acetylglucosamine 2-epimerase [Methanoregula sp.]|nr:UDP-N-acetylglucosamine 2-epimerase [Methanoregula sp.]
MRSHHCGIIEGLFQIQKFYDMPIIFPMHPRTQKMMREFGISDTGITIANPIGYLAFWLIEAQARLILTNSGCVREEACILYVPFNPAREYGTSRNDRLWGKPARGNGPEP